MRIQSTEVTQLGTGWAGSEQDPAPVNKWGEATYRHLQHLHAGPDAATAGVICTPAYLLFTGGRPEHTALV